MARLKPRKAPMQIHVGSSAYWPSLEQWTVVHASSRSATPRIAYATDGKTEAVRYTMMPDRKRSMIVRWRDEASPWPGMLSWQECMTTHAIILHQASVLHIATCRRDHGQLKVSIADSVPTFAPCQITIVI